MTQQFHSLGMTQKTWKLPFTQDSDMSVHDSFAHNYPKLEASQMSINKWMITSCDIFPQYLWFCIIIKRKEATGRSNMGILKNKIRNGSSLIWRWSLWCLWFHLCEVLEQIYSLLLGGPPIHWTDPQCRWGKNWDRGDLWTWRWNLTGKGHEKTLWKNICGRRLGYTDTCISQNSAALHLRWVHFALVKFTLKEKKTHKQILSPSYNRPAEIFRGAVAWCLLLLLKCIQKRSDGWMKDGWKHGQVYDGANGAKWEW